MSSAFVTELQRRLHGHGPALTYPLTWIAQGLAEESSSIEQLIHTENQQQAADQVSIGRDLEVALLEMAERNDVAEYRFFATALALQSQTGGGLTETLETLADTIRKRENARKRGLHAERRLIDSVEHERPPLRLTEPRVAIADAVERS